MTTAAQILRSIELAAELASKEPLDVQEQSFSAYLAGTLRSDGPEAKAIAEKVFALGMPPATDGKAG